MSFMKAQAEVSAGAFLGQQSHNCNSNIDRLKKGPVDWSKIEGSGTPFVDQTFPADQSMLSWKEYPRSIGGLSKYLNWFKDFKRPLDLLKKEKKGKGRLSLFGKQFEKTKEVTSINFEQGSVGDNYLLTILAALADRADFVPSLFT